MPQATPKEPQPPALGRALTLVHTGAATTRSELTSKLGLTRTAVGHLAGQLVRSTTRPCIGVGVALPSALGDDGSALAALYLDWPAALPARRLLAAELARHRLRLPVALGNDANLAALAEP